MADREKLEVQVTTQGADKAASELDKVNRKADELDNKKVGLNLGDIAGPAGVAGVALALGGVVDHMADAAVQADNLANLTGDSVEQASRLNAVWKQSGADAKDLQDVLLQMNGVLSTNADIAKQLGVNLEDGATIGQRFEQVAAALDRIPDAAHRSQIASQVFGEEGVRQYNALRGSVDDLSQALEDVPEGSVFTEEDVAHAREMKAELVELKANAQALANTLGKAVIPIVNDVADAIRGWFDAIGDSGAALGDFLRTGNLDNTHAVESFAESEQAARDFDRSLLDGLTTFSDVQQRVRDLTGDYHAANLVALEWAETQKAEVNAALEEQANKLASADEAWTKYIDSVNQAKGAAEGAPGSFDEMSRAAERAMGDIESAADRAARAVDAVSAAAQAVADAITDAFDDIDARFRQQDTLAEIAQGWEDIATSAEEAVKGGADDRRAYERDVRDQRRAVLDLLESIDSLPPDRKIKLATEIEQGSIQTLHDIVRQLEGGIVVPVSFQPQAGFTGVNGVFSPTQASPVINGVNNAIPSGNITNIYPVGTTPTSAQQDLTTFYRRNGITRS